MNFAKWVYRIAGIYGLFVLAPLLVLERTVSQTSPPAITGMAWQAAFLVISGDPQRFRSLMPVTWLEKTWGLMAIVLYIQNRISPEVLALGLIDLLLAAFFVAAYITTTQSRVRVIDSLNEPATSVPRRAGQR